MLHLKNKNIITPQQATRIFEENIHELLKMSHKTIFRENDIKSEYGINNICIDHLLISDDICFCIQDQYQETSSYISKINHFIICVQNIQLKLKKKCIAIYLSKIRITKPSQDSFDEQNRLNNNIFFINIYDENSDTLEYKIMQILYENKIYLYDSEDSCIMLDNDKY